MAWQPDKADRKTDQKDPSFDWIPAFAGMTTYKSKSPPLVKRTPQKDLCLFYLGVCNFQNSLVDFWTVAGAYWDFATQDNVLF